MNEHSGLTIALGIIGLGVVLALSACSGPQIEASAVAAIEDYGFTDVVIGDYAWRGCGDDDTTKLQFTAKNINGRAVAGVACSSWTKGWTVRINR